MKVFEENKVEKVKSKTMGECGTSCTKLRFSGDKGIHNLELRSCPWGGSWKEERQRQAKKMNPVW